MNHRRISTSIQSPTYSLSILSLPQLMALKWCHSALTSLEVTATHRVNAKVMNIIQNAHNVSNSPAIHHLQFVEDVNTPISSFVSAHGVADTFPMLRLDLTDWMQ